MAHPPQQPWAVFFLDGTQGFHSRIHCTKPVQDWTCHYFIIYRGGDHESPPFTEESWGKPSIVSIQNTSLEGDTSANSRLCMARLMPRTNFSANYERLFVSQEEGFLDISAYIYLATNALWCGKNSTFFFYNFFSFHHQYKLNLPFKPKTWW